MESYASQDLAALALQIQALTANVEELAKQNQEMRSQLQQEGNRDTNRNKDEANNNRRNGPGRTDPSDGDSNDLLKSMWKEMDKLKNAMKEKTKKNLDRMVKMTNSPFTTRVLEFPLLPKFRLPPVRFCAGRSRPPSRGARVWFSKLTRSSVDDFEQLYNAFVWHFVRG